MRSRRSREAKHRATSSSYYWKSPPVCPSSVEAKSIDPSQRVEEVCVSAFWFASLLFSKKRANNKPALAPLPRRSELLAHRAPIDDDDVVRQLLP